MRFRASWAVILAAALLVGLLAYGVASKRTDTSIDDATATGKRIDAPTARLPVLGADGESSLADYKGKVVVLNFWASWCKPCTEELPLLEKTHKAISGENALVLGANYQDVSDNALGFVRRFKLTYPSLRDKDGEFADRYGSRAFPETFVVDRRGRIAATRRGPVDQKWLDADAAAAAEGEGVRLALLALVLLVFATGAAPRASLPDIEDEVMCVECKTALNVSTSAVAEQERDFIRRQIALGKTKQEVKDALVEQFGPGVLATPEEKGFDLAAYLVPIGLLAGRARRAGGRGAPLPPPPGGGRAGVRAARRRRRAPPGRRARGLRPPVNDGVDTTVVAAFAVGFVSFISPCVLPLVPGYLSAVSGVTMGELQRGERSRVLLPAIVFCLSFTVVFVALGMTATSLGSTLQDSRGTLDKIAGVVIIALGLLFVITPLVPRLNREWRPDALISRAGSGGPLIAGAAFAFAWTPCVGPTLGAILTAASVQDTVGKGALLLACYSAGLAVPFMLTAIAFNRATTASRWLRDRWTIVTAISGVVLIGMGVLLLTGELTRLNGEAQNALDSLGLNVFKSL